MKLYQLFILYTVLFQSFACFGMDNPSYKELWQIIKTGNKKVFMCKLGRQELVNYCRIQLAQKNLQKLDAETLELKKEVEDLQAIDRNKKLENTKLLNKIDQMQQETKLLQKALVCIEEKKSIITTQNKEFSIQKDTVPQKRLIKRLPKISEKPLTGREKFNGLKILKSQYNVREQSVLIDKLREEADRAYFANHSDFDRETHFLCKRINAKYRFVFCPCTRQLAIVDYNLKGPLPKDLPCPDNCSFYKPTNTSASNTSTESDTEEENLEPTLLTKEIIEKICD